VADLKGKRVSTGLTGSGTEIKALRVLEINGVTPDSLRVHDHHDYPEAAQAIKEGNLDAFAWDATLPGQAIVELARTPGIFLADKGALLDAVGGETRHDIGQLIERGRQFAEGLQVQEPNTVKATLMTLLSRAEIGSGRVEIKLSRPRLADLLAGQSIDLAEPPQITAAATDDVVTLTVPARLKRVGREMRMLVENSDDQTPADLGLLRIVARAHDIQIRLTQSVEMTVHDIAREEHVSAAYVYSVLRLAGLAPEIVTAIVNGRNPPQLTAKKLMRLSPHLPIDWAEQRKFLGFS
jgi:hypothetical protein